MLNEIAAQALQEIFLTEPTKKEDCAKVLVNADAQMALFPEGSPHRAALPHIEEMKLNRVRMAPGMVAVDLDVTPARFFDGHGVKAECYKILRAAEEFPKPRAIQPYQERDRRGKLRLKHGKPVTRKPKIKGTWINEDFSGVRFVEVDFFGFEGQGCNFENAVFENCRMNNATFEECNLRGAKFRGMRGSRHKEGSLRWTNLRGSDLSHADLSNVDIREANFGFTKAEGTDFRGANAIATSYYGMTGAPILEADQLRGSSKFSFEMRESLTQGDVEVAHSIPKSLSEGEWGLLNEDSRRRLIGAGIVEKNSNTLEWEVREDLLAKTA